MQVVNSSIAKVNKLPFNFQYKLRERKFKRFLHLQNVFAKNKGRCGSKASAVNWKFNGPDLIPGSELEKNPL